MVFTDVTHSIRESCANLKNRPCIGGTDRTIEETERDGREAPEALKKTAPHPTRGRAENQIRRPTGRYGFPRGGPTKSVTRKCAAHVLKNGNAPATTEAYRVFSTPSETGKPIFHCLTAADSPFSAFAACRRRTAWDFFLHWHRNFRNYSDKRRMFGRKMQSLHIAHQERFSFKLF